MLERSKHGDHELNGPLPPWLHFTNIESLLCEIPKARKVLSCEIPKARKVMSCKMPKARKVLSCKMPKARKVL